MPVHFGVPGYDLALHDRIATLVAMVGGPVKAAKITGRTRAHIDNIRKPDSPLRLDDMLALAKEAGVSLDWVATGYQVRPDIAAAAQTGISEGAAGAFEGVLPGFSRLLPLKPELVRQAGATVERWAPSEIAVSEMWLDGRGLNSATARYSILDDDAMQPRLQKGALVILDVRPAKPKAGVYLVELDGDAVARRFRRMPDGNAELVADADPTWRWQVAGDVPLYRIVWAGHDLT